MPRRAVVPQESLGDFNAPSSSVHSAHNVSLEPAPSPARAEAHARATRVLATAHCLLEQLAAHRRALQWCLGFLHTADPEALFFYCPDPATLTPAPGPGPKARKAWRLRSFLTTALRQVDARQDTIRLNALFTISRLGLPVAVWYFLIPGPLPLTLAALTPRAAPSAPPPVSPAPGHVLEFL
jgi:hypothetical protein